MLKSTPTTVLSFVKKFILRVNLDTYSINFDLKQNH